jgi:hypothetical protein
MNEIKISTIDWECRVFWGSEFVVIRGYAKDWPSWTRRLIMRLVLGSVWIRKEPKP